MLRIEALWDDTLEKPLNCQTIGMLKCYPQYVSCEDLIAQFKWALNHECDLESKNILRSELIDRSSPATVKDLEVQYGSYNK